MFVCAQTIFSSLSVVSCQLSVVSCQLSVVSGQLSVVSGQWSVVSCQLSVVSCQLSVVSCQLSVVSCQLSVVSGKWVSAGGCFWRRKKSATGWHGAKRAPARLGGSLALERRVASSRSWPKISGTFANELRRLARTLAENGLFVFFKQTDKARLIILTTRPHLDQSGATIQSEHSGGCSEALEGRAIRAGKRARPDLPQDRLYRLLHRHGLSRCAVRG